MFGQNVKVGQLWPIAPIQLLLVFVIKDLNYMHIDQQVGENTECATHFNEVKMFKRVDSLKMNSDRIGDNSIPT